MISRSDREGALPFSPEPELSRRVGLHQADDRPVHVTIEATPQERSELQERFGLEALHAFRAEVDLGRLDHGDVYTVEGTLHAEVTQLCVVTLEPIENVVEGPFHSTYVRVDQTAMPEPAEIAGDEDEPEPFTGDSIDVGEAVVQEFASMLDPYPRLPEAAVEDSFRGDEPAVPGSPFAVLEKLRGKRDPEAD